MQRINKKHMPSIPEWGIDQKYLWATWEGVNPTNADNSPLVAYGNAFEAARNAGLPEDKCLAVAACVREAARASQPNAPRALVGIDISYIPLPVQIPGVEPSLSVQALYEEPSGHRTEEAFSYEDIMKYDIPSLTGRQLTEGELVADVLPEALWDRGTRNTGDKLSRVVTSGGDPRGLIRLYKTSFERNAILLAQIPLTRLQLTPAERFLLNEGGFDGQGVVAQARLQGRKVEARDIQELQRKIAEFRNSLATNIDKSRKGPDQPEREEPTILDRALGVLGLSRRRR